MRLPQLSEPVLRGSLRPAGAARRQPALISPSQNMLDDDVVIDENEVGMDEDIDLPWADDELAS